MFKNLSKNSVLIFIAIVSIGIHCWIVIVVYWPDMSTNSMPQGADQVGEQDSKYTWKTKSKWVAGVALPSQIEYALFVIGKSRSGRDVLFTIERLANGERITITCPMPNVTPPKELSIYVSKDHCTPNAVGGSIPERNIPKACCRIRHLQLVRVSANIVKGQGYVLHIHPRDVGQMLSYLTGAHTLWLYALEEGENWFAPTKGDRFTFRVAGFAEKFDLTTYDFAAH